MTGTSADELKADMNEIKRLQREALEACRFRGHDMGQFYTDTWCATRQYAFCQRCGKQVVINSWPQPNEIDIGGEAVALDCDDPSRFNSDGSLK